MKAILERERISLTECRKILNTKGKNYSDQELNIIRSWIYHLVEITLEFLETQNSNQVEEIKKLFAAMKCSKKRKAR